MTVRIELATEPVTTKLGEAREQLADMTPLYRDIGNYMIGATRDRFQRGEAPDGSRWQPKSATTLARYRAAGHGSRPRPLIGASERLSTEITAFANGDGVEIGSSLIYSGVMQEGAPKGAFGTNRAGSPLPWGDIPARVWLGLSDEDERTIIAMTDEHIASALDD